MSVNLDAQPDVAILDYGMGNLRSVHRAFLKAGASARIVDHPDEANRAEALVFPGQGAIVDTMRLLNDRGWAEFIRNWIQEDRPFFGICLGLQALFSHSEEGDTCGLGIFPGQVRKFAFPKKTGAKVPHMGWNNVVFAERLPEMRKGIDPRTDQFYFVHSYFVVPEDRDLIWATTGYGGIDFCSAIQRRNLIATQFHPEKSQSKGLQLYRNFVHKLCLRTSCS